MADVERRTINLTDLVLANNGFGAFSYLLPYLDVLVNNCVVANGCFDLLHPGHLTLIQSLDTIAFQMRLVPVVALNSDASVRRIKGNGRPIVPQESRAALINNLRWPVTVVIFDEDDPQELMDLLRPRVVLKGSEYAKESVIRWSGSQVITVDMLPNWSTSGIIGGIGG
jgi:D-beta-D-heptose 7-phosphate kinase/D-beta-D-heptose 1-phosphate adenosyltransferase